MVELKKIPKACFVCGIQNGMRFEIPRVPLIVGLFLVLELVVLFLFARESNDHIRAAYPFAGTILGGAFALYVYLRSVDDRRKTAAGSLIERWNAPDRYELKRIMKRISDEKLDPSTLSRRVKGEQQTLEVEDQRLKVTAMLNFYEELAICVRDGSANEKKLYDFFSSVLEDAYSRLVNYIQNERRVDSSADYFCEMEWLAMRWRDKNIASRLNSKA